MKPVPPRGSAPAPSANTVAPGIAAFLEVLTEEAALMESLAGQMVQQRAAVSSSNSAALEASLPEIGRTTERLRAVRAHRDSMTLAVGGDPGEPLASLAARLGGSAQAPFEALRPRLARAARAVSREAAVNRAVLRRAMEAGEVFLQELFGGAPLPGAGYGPAESRRGAARSGAMLDRRG